MTKFATPSVIHLTPRPKRHFQTSASSDPNSGNDLWWTTSGGSTFIPGSSPPHASHSSTSSTPPSQTSTRSPFPTSSGASSSTSNPSQTLGPPGPSSIPLSPSDTLYTLTSTFPVTITGPSTTITAFSQSVYTSTGVATALPESQTISNLQTGPVCIGDGLDASSIGLLSSIVIPTAIGLLLWLLFAIIRPRYRQIYGLREWFVQPGLRPKPLGRSWWAFLFPHVPIVPSVPTDVDDTGKSVEKDAELFPSDEQLMQRTLWVCLLIAMGWSLLALAGLLPLYTVSTPCLAHSANPASFTGVYSVLQDLSLLRLLQLLDNSSVTTTSGTVLVSREIVDGHDYAPTVRTRVIILTVLAIVLGLLPMLWKVLHEFTRLANFRYRWMVVRCHNQEMGWLSARYNPGFVGWGEKKLKTFIQKAGLSVALESPEGSRTRSSRRRMERDEESARLEIDVQSLFTIGDTTRLALLIDERDEILENLEIAETKYINSFKLSTPDPSLADFVPIPRLIPGDANNPPRPYISRPRPLAGSSNRRRRRRNPAHGSSSLPPPTSYVMPSQYYKLRVSEGINGGQFTEGESSARAREPSLADSFNSRVVGSRFQEVNRNSEAFGHIPIGSQVMLEKNGRHVPVITDSPLPDAALYGPNGHSSWDTAAFNEGLPDHQWFSMQRGAPDTIQELPEDEWVDVLREAPEAFQNGEEYDTQGSSRRRPRPPRNRNNNNEEERRETFPLRNRGPAATEEQMPPHLRLQPRQPFVRPLSGLDHDDLGLIYADISVWRSRLKAINNEIHEAQTENYNEIADGAGIKGWLLIGKGLRHIPGMQLIEGRAKEDIRWDELQSEGGFMRGLAFWTIVVTVALLLAVALLAAAGLSLATAPDFAHYFPFFGPISNGNQLGAGVASGLAAAVAATLFISIALMIVHYTGQVGNSVSVSGSQLVIFKAVFYILTIAATIWLFTAGSVLFAMRGFNARVAEAASIANGTIYMSAFAMMLVMNVAFIFPALLMLQPFRLFKVTRAEKLAVTPRQRFRAIYPRTYNPAHAMGCCILAILFASAFTLVFPLLGPAVVLLLLLTLIAHRFLIGYVYGRTHSQTGGILQLWILKRIGTVLALQPLVLGLILLSRQFWIEGGILCGAALFVVVFVESYCRWKTHLPGRRSLSPLTRDSLDTFLRAARPTVPRDIDEENTSLVSSARNTRARGSFASVLEMMSLTLAVMPSPSQARGPVPLETETLDDLTATERAARTHPDAPPRLPPLSFADHAEEMSGILYAPELLAPPPTIWLPNDVGGIAQSEAVDLQRYHNLNVTLDVRATEDVNPRRSTSPTHSSRPRS
ncbi:hypothetical protein EIP91_011533 [Steccherinum ochraceum]|uniref:CSC1/OSCA1-like 7TM region domain-containing protein n=1 Tax=Steccherinum ochraceum TaxID=92696 RepID=A0A4R0RHS3_9APHY|nr:hypothetical protein EIP91_011533 [Steccherinum ochraceum]